MIEVGQEPPPMYSADERDREAERNRKPGKESKAKGPAKERFALLTHV